MLTRRQLLGGLVACVPLMGMTKIDNAKIKNKNYLVLFKNIRYLEGYDGHPSYYMTYNQSVKIQVDNITVNSDSTINISKCRGGNLNFTIFNIKPDEFGIPVFHEKLELLEII